MRVYNHKAPDMLLVKYDAAAAKRDRWAAAAAAARLRLKALGAAGYGEEQKGDADSTGGKAGSSGLAGWKCRKAAKRLAKAEAEEGKWRQLAAELEAQVEAARQAALAQPLGTAFIALFK